MIDLGNMTPEEVQRLIEEHPELAQQFMNGFGYDDEDEDESEYDDYGESEDEGYSEYSGGEEEEEGAIQDELIDQVLLPLAA